MEKPIDLIHHEKHRVTLSVDYTDIPHNERVFEIDEEKAAAAIGMVFGHRKVKLTVEIRSGLTDSEGEAGHYNRGKIVVWQDPLIQSVRKWFKDVNGVADKTKPETSISDQKKNVIQEIKQTLKFLPHKLAGIEPSYILDSEQQIACQKILDMAGVTDNQIRRYDMTKDLAEEVIRRATSEIIAHEVGHAKNNIRLELLGSAIYITATTLGLLTAQSLYSADVNYYIAAAVGLGTPILSFGGIFFGTPVLDEKLAYETEKKFFSLFINSIKINREILERSLE